MNETLKAVGNLGAELGAAKAEVDRLRGLLEEVHPYVSGCSSDLWQRCHAALSQQAEPTDTYTAVEMASAAAQGFRDGQAAVEQDTAQDERGDFFQWWNSELRAELRRSCAESWAYCIWKASDANTRYNVAFHLSEIEQTEQQPEQLPYWEPCNPGCDPEFNGARSRHCAELCHNARAALSAQRGEA